MASYYLQLKSNYILECGYALENLLTLHNSPIPNTSLSMLHYFDGCNDILLKLGQSVFSSFTSIREIPHLLRFSIESRSIFGI